MPTSLATCTHLYQIGWKAAATLRPFDWLTAGVDGKLSFLAMEPLRALNSGMSLTLPTQLLFLQRGLPSHMGTLLDVGVFCLIRRMIDSSHTSGFERVSLLSI